jgi:hypothetical protein
MSIRFLKKWWILSLAVTTLLLAAVGLYAVGSITNRDRLVVLNSNLEILSGIDVAKKIPLDRAPRDLSNEEIGQIKGLLLPANRHLTRDIYGRLFRIQLVVDGRQGTKHLIARQPK